MSQVRRNDQGGQIDRSKPLHFYFDGVRYQGYEGDTLASALLANGVQLFGRSFKYHRPRGLLSAGSDEPNALVELRNGDRKEPNTRMTTIELYGGLEARSQNRWPSLKFDMMAVNNWFSPLLSAGFYYKTFMWPASFWTNVYERVIRRAAGLGTAATEPDPDQYEQHHAHCDVLVVGAGPAGLMAARAAAASGARVIVVDEQVRPGGALNSETYRIDGAAGTDWAQAQAQALAALDNVHLLLRTTVFGYYDHDVIGAVEKVADHLPKPLPGQPRQRLWTLYPKRVIIAAGASERPLAFGNNDLPGVMLASAARTFANGYGVRAGERALITTNNSDAYRSAFDLQDAGVQIVAVADSRKHPEAELVAELERRGIPLHCGKTVGAAEGSRSVRAALLVAADGTAEEPLRVDCDLIASSAGWNPNVHLHSQARGKLLYDESLVAFTPVESVAAACSIGAAAGHFSLQDCLAKGFEAGAAAARQAGCHCAAGETAPPSFEIEGDCTYRVEPLWLAPTPWNRRYKQFIDQQNDVKASDIELAAQEGYDSVELLKRYTTQGMATDQGKTGNVSALALLAGQLGVAIPTVGATTFRPPYVPVAMGNFAGHAVGAHFMPTRRTALHDWNAARGAVFVEAGLWLRARYYPQNPGESLYDCYVREAEVTRKNVALVDVSSLGKIDVQGPDAAEFLNRLYINNWLKLPIGKARYGIMLREDGMVFDDGTTSRLAENHYFMTTTTANAGPVLAHMEYYQQTIWPELDVVFCSATEQWTGIAIAGPNSRKLLQKVVDIDLGNEAFPFMAVAECKLQNIPARLFRISFSGELAYEINVPADYGQQAWEILLAAGAELSVGVYGTEALGTMRIEKGHVAGSELDGRTNADDLGLAGMANLKKHFIGKHLCQRPAQKASGRLQVVGLKSLEADRGLRIGAHLINEKQTLDSVSQSQGHVSATTYSPSLDAYIALGLLRDGRSRHGEELMAVSPVHDEKIRVQVCHPIFIDRAGELVRA